VNRGRPSVVAGSLPDYLVPGLDLVVIGLNPSPASLAAGFHYAHPRNRFWPALRATGILPAGCGPGPATQVWLRDHAGLGFTDIVERSTSGAADLRAADYRAGAPRLAARLDRYRPRVAWFNGKGVYAEFLRHGLGRRPGRVEPGAQALALAGGTRVFVTPNPSPANAAFSLEDIAAWYAAAVRYARAPAA